MNMVIISLYSIKFDGLIDSQMENIAVLKPPLVATKTNRNFGSWTYANFIIFIILDQNWKWDWDIFQNDVDESLNFVVIYECNTWCTGYWILLSTASIFTQTNFAAIWFCEFGPLTKLNCSRKNLFYSIACLRLTFASCYDENYFCSWFKLTMDIILLKLWIEKKQWNFLKIAAKYDE